VHHPVEPLPGAAHRACQHRCGRLAGGPQEGWLVDEPDQVVQQPQVARVGQGLEQAGVRLAVPPLEGDVDLPLHGSEHQLAGLSRQQRSSRACITSASRTSPSTAASQRSSPRRGSVTSRSSSGRKVAIALRRRRVATRILWTASGRSRTACG
jgi:hypothetical protein